MTYTEATELLFNSLPMYQRVGAAAYKANLDNTEALMQWLGHPERQLRCIHVAGTNGKGSVSHMLASILMKAGCKVGLYTSPHLVDFRERIRVDGVMIEPDEVVRFVEQWWQPMRERGLSFFEMTVGLAFDYFVRQHVDIAVIEVGMGGRLDSTNVVAPDLSVITNIGLDHTQFLGKTLPAIAGEKAGIIKQGVPVVIGETHPETCAVFAAKAAECHSDILFADQHYSVSCKLPEGGLVDPAESTVLRFDAEHDGMPVMRNCTCSLAGAYQKKNIATVLAAIDVLRSCSSDKFYQCVGQSEVEEGIRDVVQSTGLHGRWQLLRTNPTVICETAHNVDGITVMLQKLGTLRYDRLHLVYGCVNDKDYTSILRLLPHKSADFPHEVLYYYTRPSVPRGLDQDQLAETAHTLGMRGDAFPTVDAALQAAIPNAQKNDLILVTGSIFLIADALGIN
ncbi:MAG: bifunctional folylpolyglutamate synthase/dihydrofolate synthase [Bacteroidales bacterium]|nr:bifunctional folylpolyglutamate synthase/dihydrofolate synthase [Bacteroidales bacterium]